MTASYPVLVRYAETDQMGVVHHAAYVVWLEEARTRLLADAGLPYHVLEREGLFFPVVELSLRYHRPLRYGETAQVEVRLEEVKSRRVAFAYRVLRPGGGLAAAGRTVHVPQDEKGRAVRLPPKVYEKLRALAEA